ncbi:hypothetical protein [Haloechinothrix sp. LS1_15]|uniref:hypothetical protein n=1 Tax=Haloechinothrix sp. LS1_15 TaxID=2652248 RepID=UPI002944AD10|nr:hypothetical protein [Haloechinothrix sp. LS1_15]MDV6013456.1 hypothetical protein [Haloechinothrix sp. LS1_15]
MGSDGHAVSEETLSEVTGQLTNAADHLDSLREPPDTVTAGTPTPAIAAAVAHLAAQTEEFMGQLGGAGQAVTDSWRDYARVEDDHAGQLDDLGPRDTVERDDTSSDLPTGDNVA